MLNHLAIIPDGNRRYAHKRGITPWKGHSDGRKKLEDVIGWAFQDFGIPVLTVYTFSIPNFRRPKNEVAMLMRYFEDAFDTLSKSEMVHKERVRVRAIGRIHLLPEAVRLAIMRVEEATAGYDSHYLNLAIAYDGRAEIADAVRRLVRGTRRINEKSIKGALYLPDMPDIDLIIRTSGEKRISGFMLWNASYAEMIFREELWPEYTKQMLEHDIKEFEGRQRRFGH